MVDLESLWIGDLVLLKKSGRVGKFEGIQQDKAIVNVAGKKILSTASNLALHDEEEQDFFIENSVIQEPQTVKVPATNSIDLHIEVLNPNMQGMVAERILAYQIEQAKQFLEQALYHKVPRIEIIHGKGEGVLRSEIVHLLSLYDEVQFTFPINNGGATEVWLQGYNT